jgi:Predicted Na+-dependent transporter
MKTTLDVGIPFVAFLIMVVVGLELTVADFRKVIRSPRMVTAALIGQILLLPLCAVALSRSSTPSRTS